MDNLKQKFLLDESVTFLNHGSYGACPKPVFEDYQNWQRSLELQPVEFLTKDIWNALRNSRESISKFVGCGEDEVLFFNNPTSAIANVINSLELNKGDEVLMTDHEYGALIRQWNLWGEKNDVKIIQQKIPIPVTSKEKFIETFWRGVTKNTKVIFTGDVFQIDSPYLDTYSNGLSYLIERAKEHPLYTHVALEKGERSDLANLANDLL